MNSPRLKEASQVCLHTCCPTPFLSITEDHTKPDSKPPRTSSVCRRNFAQTTASSIFPGAKFTDHESLPSLADSLAEFNRTYPQYSDTDRVDEIRDREYYHLSESGHACLDYIGIGLFSFSQLQTHKNRLVSSSLPSPSPSLDFPFFGISYRTGNLKAQLLRGGGEDSALESAMKRRIMAFLNLSDSDYAMVFTANRTSAFRLVAESYPFKSSPKLLTVYDYESEAVGTMVQSSERRGARAVSAEFSWPRLRISSSKLKDMIVGNKKKAKAKKKKGVFVFPLHSRVTGARYPYTWMSVAQENDWHVLIDACALGPKDMDCLALSLLRPDFLVCSFYKVFGENPSGFGCLFVKKPVVPILEDSTLAPGIVNVVPAAELLRPAEDESSELESPTSFSGPLSDPTSQIVARSVEIAERSGSGSRSDGGESSEVRAVTGDPEAECRGLDLVDSLGLTTITTRLRYLINWLVNALTKLEHPNSEGAKLVRVYGPKVRFDRGPAVAFNVYDWKGEKVEPVLVQKLADRTGLSLSYGFLSHIQFSDKYAEMKSRVVERRERGGTDRKCEGGITVVTAALGFLANFEDVYRLWGFVARFLDADFVEKERWRYTALNQNTLQV